MCICFHFVIVQTFYQFKKKKKIKYGYDLVWLGLSTDKKYGSNKIAIHVNLIFISFYRFFLFFFKYFKKVFFFFIFHPFGFTSTKNEKKKKKIEQKNIKNNRKEKV